MYLLSWFERFETYDFLNFLIIPSSFHKIKLYKWFIQQRVLVKFTQLCCESMQTALDVLNFSFTKQMLSNSFIIVSFEVEAQMFF